MACIAGPSPVSAKYLEIEELFEEELLLVLPLGQPLVDNEKIRLSHVESCPFVLLNEALCLSDNIMSFCASALFSRSPWSEPAN